MRMPSWAWLKTSKGIAALLVTACAVVLLVGIGFNLYLGGSSGPIPRQYARGLTFPLYYPKQLPAGYAVDATSFERKGNVLIFSVNTPARRKVAVSEQAIPAAPPTRSPTKAPIPIPGEADFRTPIGQAHVGLWGEKYVSDIMTQETWIILNVTGLTKDQAIELTKAFRAL